MAPAPTRTVVELGEWTTIERGDIRLVSEADRVLAHSLQDEGRRLVVEEMRHGLRVASRSHVGVVRLQELDLHVVPKYAGGNLGVLQMLARTRGLDALRRAETVRDLAVEGMYLHDLVALLLAEAAGQIARDGMLQDYVTREDTISVVRGRLLPFEQVTRRPGRVDILECRYDEFETDIMENRLIAAALDAVGRHSRHHGVRNHVNKVRVVFQGACDASALDPRWLHERIEYHRRNEHYRDAHVLARLVLRQLAVRDVYAPGNARSFAFLLDMDRLFEEFVTWLLGERLHRTEAVVEAQASNRLVFEDTVTGQAYTSVRPDMLIRWLDRDGRPQRLPVDAKYKLYGDKRIDQGDLYQLFLYAYAYASRDSDAPARSFILFPANGHPRHDVRVRDANHETGARITALGIDLQTVLQALERQDQPHVPALDEVAIVVDCPPRRPASTRAEAQQSTALRQSNAKAGALVAEASNTTLPQERVKAPLRLL